MDHEGIVGDSKGCQLDRVKENLERAGAGFKDNCMCQALCINAYGSLDLALAVRCGLFYIFYNSGSFF